MNPSFPAPRPLVYRDGHLELSGTALADLAAEFGTPLYVYSGDDLLTRARMLSEAFSRVRHTLCYAVKANSSLALLRLLGKAGCGFDIVSGGELERVRRAAPEALLRTVFSGVGKQVWEIDAAIQAGILLFNIESEGELELLSARARFLGKIVRFALRVNPDVSVKTHPYISTGLREHKFGLPIENARKVYRHALVLGGLQASGVSFHIGSQIRDVAPFLEAVERLEVLSQQLRVDGHSIEYVDVGGGLGIEYGQGGFNPREQIREYAEVLVPSLSRIGAHLLLEPGRFLVAQAGVLLTSVIRTKENGTKRFVITDAGMNDLIRPALYGAHHEVLPIKLAHAAPQRADVVGPVCESSDFLAQDRDITAEAGDMLAVLDAGAYGMSLSSNYNTRPRPAEVLVHAGQARLIRKRESLEDVLAGELL